MDVLDSHLEALAFNYVRFGFFTLVNNLWTWVAVVTAAVSFWRLRVSGFLKSDHLNADALNLTPPSSDSAVEPQPPPPSSKPTTTSTSSASSEAAVSSFCDCDVRGARGVTKGRFTAYYGEERESESRLLTAAVAEEWDNNDGGFGFDVFGGVGEELKKVVRVRLMADMGLYRYQDLTAINGNVVKLWDGCRIRSSSNILDYEC